MSTNYYLTPPVQSPLSVFGKLHIGLSAGGWSFNFQAYRHPGTPAQTQSVDVGDLLAVQAPVPETPLFELTSWSQWKALLEQPGSKIQDEYGRDVPLQKFFDYIEKDKHPVKGQGGADRATSLMSHYDEQKKRGAVDPQTCWKDAEGFTFSLINFS